MADYNRNQGSNRNSNQEWNENRNRRNRDEDNNWNSGNSNSDWDQSRWQSRHQRDDYQGQTGDKYTAGRYGRHFEGDFNTGSFGNDRSSGYSSYYGSDSGGMGGSGSSYGPGSSGDSYGTQGYNSGSQYGSGGYSSGSSYGSSNRDRNLYDRDYQGINRSGYSESGTRLGGASYGSGYGYGQGNSGSYGNRDRSYYRQNENSGGNYGNMSHRDRDNDRNWWDRATDEVSSWFGDEDAERRRDRDRQLSHRGKGPKNYNRSDDRIKEDINDKLSDDPFIDASDIDVTVSNGEVTLTGTVDHRSTKRRAEDLAEAVSGVKNVENRIRVASTSSMVSGSSGSGSSSMSGTTGTTSGTSTQTESTSTSAVPGSDRSRTTKRDYISG
jgi:osmotically-inducible protein OsmY